MLDHWTLEEQLAGRQEPPQVQRAAEDLGIEIIWANSPQAKGRIERAWGTFQDRLISELRLASSTSIEEANTVLEQYRRDHNRRFARQPKDKSPAWRKTPKGMSLAEVCGFHTTAKVSNDSIIRYQGKTYELSGPTAASIAGQTVDIRHLLNGELRVYLGDHSVHRSRIDIPIKAPNRRRQSSCASAQSKPAGRRRRTFKQIASK